MNFTFFRRHKTAPGAELSALADRHYESGDPARKGSAYFVEYERIFRPIKDQPVRILELGVWGGASIQLWRDYFPRATIVGIDLRDRPARFPDDARIHFIQGSHDDPSTLDRAQAAVGGQFDIIIDDGSHVGYFTKRSFVYLFPKALKPGGYYIIEDIGASFMVGTFDDAEPFVEPALVDGGTPTQFPSHQNGMVGVVKQLVDHTLAKVMTGKYTRLPIERMTIISNFVVVQKAD